MSSKIKLAYFGTPIFSVELLNKILTEGKDTFDVMFVVTQPDRPVGRNQTITPSPIKESAKKHGIAAYDRIDENVEASLKNCDIALVFAYGHLINSDLLRAPKYGFWNVHPSALPLYRGASPVAYPLILGDKAGAISLIRMDERMDHGPIIAQKTTEIPPDAMHNDLLTKMAQMSYYILSECVQNISTDTLVFTAQNEDNKTYTQLLSRQSGYIAYPLLIKLIHGEEVVQEELPDIILKFLKKNPRVSYSPPNGTQLLWNLYRGLSPWPGIWTEIEMDGAKKRLKIVEMSFNGGNPEIVSVQLEGKKPVSYKSFADTYRIL